MTFGTGETLNNNAPSDNSYDSQKERVLLVPSPQRLPRLISDTKAKLALRPPLQRNGIDVSQIDITLRNGEKLSWCREKGIIELPKAVRKKIWRQAIVHDKKLFICSC